MKRVPAIQRAIRFIKRFHGEFTFTEVMRLAHERIVDNPPYGRMRLSQVIEGGPIGAAFTRLVARGKLERITRVRYRRLERPHRWTTPKSR